MNDEKQAGRQAGRAVNQSSIERHNTRGRRAPTEHGTWGSYTGLLLRIAVYLAIARLDGIIPEQSNSSTVQQPYETSKTKQ